MLFVKNTAIVTRFEDVQEVLSRDDVFTVTYGEKMEGVTGGKDFFLGMQNSPDYERDVAHMRTVLRREDVAGQIVPFVAKTAEQVVLGFGGPAGRRPAARQDCARKVGGIQLRMPAALQRRAC